MIHFDGEEPFLPLRVGYTIFREPGPSPSFPRYVRLDPPIELAIEYALWWDWDIGHLYEVEHAWIFVSEGGEVVGVESSQYGGSYGGNLKLEDGRPVLYSEPGKHALASDPGALVARRDHTVHSCGPGAGAGGVHVTPLYRDRIPKTPDDAQLVRTYLRRHAFTPRWDWSIRVQVADLPMVPWPELDVAIPRIVRARLTELDAETPREERHVLHVGHRGASAHAPENTLAAIRKAAELGAHMVELDVRMSADGVAVLSHDADVLMPGRGHVPVNDLMTTELQMSTATLDTSVPTLDVALDLCEEMHLKPYLEIKEGEAVKPTVAALSARSSGRYSVIGSFEPALVAWATDLAPHIPTSILFGSFDADPIALARGCGASYVHPCWERHPAPHTLLTPDWLARIRSEGLGVVCWHEERHDVLRALLRLGVSAVCTDRLDLMRDIAAELTNNGTSR